MTSNYYSELHFNTVGRLKEEEEVVTQPIKPRKWKDIFKILVKKLGVLLNDPKNAPDAT